MALGVWEKGRVPLGPSFLGFLMGGKLPSFQGGAESASDLELGLARVRAIGLTS